LKAARGAAFPDGKPGAGIVIKDAIADITLQQVLTRPEDFDVIATLNLNGDYLSDALAAQVGGIGIAPGGNINYITGHAVFEATHGTAPKYAGKDMVNPGSVILSGEMMLRYMGWTEAGGSHRERPQRRDRQPSCHLRLRAPDGQRDEDQVLRVRRQRHRAHVRRTTICGGAARSSAAAIGDVMPAAKAGSTPARTSGRCRSPRA
jgi:hypothetical protein